MSFIDDFKKPFNLFVTFLTIIGIIISTIGIIDRNSKKITFELSEINKIIDKNNLSNKIKIIDTNRNEIVDNVYLITGSVINNGDNLIDKSDIRIPLFFQVDSNVTIIDFSITEQFDSEVSIFSLARQDSNKLSISWKYFDPKHWFKFKILCKSNTQPLIRLRGKILGVDNFTSNKINRKKGKRLWLYLLSFLIVGYYINYTIELFPLYNREYLEGKDRVLFYVRIYLYFIVPVIMSMLCFYMYYYL